MSQNRKATKYEIWRDILVQARAWAALEGITPSGPSWMSNGSVPNRQDTIRDIMQKTLAVFQSIASS